MAAFEKATNVNGNPLSLLNLSLNHIDGDGTINILSCGDGDLSYSLALIRNLKKNFPEKSINFIATCFLQGEPLKQTHPEARSNQLGIEELSSEVKTGIDATQLHKVFPISFFHRIVWNFPQHPERRKIQRHRELLREFFESARPCLSEKGEIWVTLKGGQGGSGAELPEFVRPWSNTWQIQEHAACSGLVLAAVSEANIDGLEEAGYRSVGFRGTDRGFFTKGSLIHVFTTPETLKHVYDRQVVHPLVYRHDISFWVDETSFSDIQFESFLHDIMRPYEVSFTFSHFDSYKCPISSKSSRGYHIDLFSTTQAITKPITSDLMKQVSLSIADGFSNSSADGRYKFELLPQNDTNDIKKLKT